MLKKRICEICGNEYRPSYKEQRTCGRQCGVQLSNTTKTNNRIVVEKECPVCFKNFKPNKSQQRYCSVDCKYIGVGKSIRKEMPYCPCGKQIIGNRTKVYCSVECRHEYSTMGKIHNGLPARPNKSATCESCGEKFARPAYWPSQMRFCSDQCAKTQQRVIKPVAGKNARGYAILDSGWEIRFAGACEKYNIPWKKWDRDPVELPDNKTYYPDFLVEINNHELTVEVKGYLTEKGQQNIEAAQKVIPEFYVLREEDLSRFEEYGVLVSA